MKKNDIDALLKSLAWTGEQRQIDNAIPYGGIQDFQHLRDTMARLGYDSIETLYEPLRPANDYLPAAYTDTSGNIHLLKKPDDIHRLPPDRKDIFVFRPLKVTQANPSSSLRGQYARFAPLLTHITGISLIIGVIVLAPILYNRIVYDHIIAAGSTFGMPLIVFGVFVAMTAELGLRLYRSKQLALFGGRLDHIVSYSVFERLMFLPPQFTERASVSAQLARLRDFESVREFFTGPLAVLFFELPLVGVYMIAMIALAGWLSLIPVALMIAYALLIAAMDGKLKSDARNAASASTQRQEFLLESVTKLKAIRLAGLDDIWRQRYRALSAQASLASFRAGFSAQVLETASYVLMTLGGVATLAFGVIAVIHQVITVGALVASMMLIWRIIAPLQICCASITRLQQLVSSTKQVQRLLNVAPERDPNTPAPPLPKLKGAVTFNRVSLRYAAETEPALMGVSFEAKPGQIVAIKGNNGSGKSSILKLTLGMYQPQNGSVRIDGVDIRQFDPFTLREALCYVPQSVDLFPGTVRENLTFSDPNVSKEKLEQALRESCAWDEVQLLPHGLETQIEGENAFNISFMLKQRLNLARAYIKDAPIMLFDEASYSLGKENDDAFVKKIDGLRGKSTVLLVTHREDHMRMADILLVMHKGELTHAGPPDQVLTVLKGKK
ncbi:MAG: ATP-binding cassette domain-containing protein [Pseudomonadota bacterium]